jgi:hypothetical protein
MGFALSSVLIIVMGGCLRFAYIGRGYTQSDELIASAVVAHLYATPGLDTNWAHTWITDLFGSAQYNFSSYYVTLFAWDRLWRMLGARMDTVDSRWQLGGSTAPPTLVCFRAFSALLGTLALLAAMWLAWEMKGWWLALGVGAWLAVNPQLVQDSHYARPEAFLTLLSLILILMVFPNRRWSWSRGLAVGILFGFLTACKITMLLWWWVPFLVCLECGADQADSRLVFCGWKFIVRAGLVIAAMVGGFGVGAPQVFQHLRGYWLGIEYLRHSYGGPVGLLSPFAHFSGGMVYDYLVRYFLDTTGWWIAALYVVGLTVVVGRRQWRCALAVFGPVLVIAAFFSAQGVFIERNLSHALPLYFLGAGLGAEVLAELSHSFLGRWKPVVLATLSAAMLLLPAAMTARLVYQGFSGRSEKIAADTQEKILKRFAGTMFYSYEGSLEAGPKTFHWCWRDNGRPFLILWRLSNGTPAKDGFERLNAAFDLDDLGRIPGLFDDLSTPSGLKNYFPCSTAVFLVKGPRHSPGQPREVLQGSVPPRE